MPIDSSAKRSRRAPHRATSRRGTRRSRGSKAWSVRDRRTGAAAASGRRPAHSGGHRGGEHGHAARRGRARTSSLRRPGRPARARSTGEYRSAVTASSRSQQVEAVHRVHERKWADGLACLVGLQVADQVPAQVQIPSRLDLRQRFLDAILTERDVGPLRRRRERAQRKRLRNCDEVDVGRVAPGATGGPLHPGADRREVRDAMESARPA